MKAFTFEDIPDIMGKLYEKVDRIEKMLEEKKRTEACKEEELMTIMGAAKLLKLSVATVYTKVCKNEIPVNKKGKRLYFYRSELLEWIKSGRIKTITEIQQEVELKFNAIESLD